LLKLNINLSPLLCSSLENIGFNPQFHPAEEAALAEHREQVAPKSILSGCPLNGAFQDKEGL